MCDVGFGGDTCTVWSEENRRARKSYECDACGGRIATGDIYLSHRSMFDGYWNNARMCVPCRDTRKAFTDAHRGALIPSPSGLADTLDECIEWDSDSEAKWGPMREAMRARGQAVANG